jgi:hypothetical protein
VGKDLSRRIGSDPRAEYPLSNVTMENGFNPCGKGDYFPMVLDISTVRR